MSGDFLVGDFRDFAKPTILETIIRWVGSHQFSIGRVDKCSLVQSLSLHLIAKYGYTTQETHFSESNLKTILKMISLILKNMGLDIVQTESNIILKIQANTCLNFDD